MMYRIDELLNNISSRVAHKPDLSVITEFLRQCGNPHNQLRTIHVAGTNGKGSTTNYIRSMLQAAGYRVGTYTSPHLIKFQDRIRVNDENIDDETFLRYGNMYDDIWKQYDLNMFEISFVVSVLYFLEQNVDYAIYEVGMGGRLDCTNVITPLISVITNIGMDHMQYLGDTLELIAEEKAGIIKPHVPLITAETKPECLRIFARVCEKKEAPMMALPHHGPDCTQPLSFTYGSLQNLELGSVALYQVNNASLALEAIMQLRNRNKISITETQIRQGLLTIWRGRFEKMWDDPLTYIDGAHNLEGIRALCETLKQYPNPKTIIFCAMKDKPIYPMIQELLQISDNVILTQFAHPRVFTMEEFDGSLPIQTNSSFTLAIDAALGDRGHMVVITGSLYFIAEAREYLLKKRGE